MSFKTIFPTGKALIGMVHLQGLPGTPAYKGSMQSVIDAAMQDAAHLKAAGFDALLIENMHDLPYLNGNVGHEISAAMSVVGYLVKRAFQMPTGVQVLAAANQAALATALASGLDFIRAEAFVFGHVADEGWMDAQAGPLLRYRKNIGAEDICIFADIKKKHSAHAMTSDVNILETAKAAAFFKADAVVVTGKSTGEAADREELRQLATGCPLPVLVGSGIDMANAKLYSKLCQAMIVGSSIKEGGKWENPVSLEAASRLAEVVKVVWH